MNQGNGARSQRQQAIVQTREKIEALIVQNLPLTDYRERE